MYSECFHPDSYNNFSEHLLVEKFIKTNNNIYRYEHIHRKWEYGLALKINKEFELKTAINVGGGNSPLSALLSDSLHITEIDPVVPGKLINNINYIIDTFPSKQIDKKYEYVVCTSVIEHIEKDIDFFKNLLKITDRVLFLTMDFHPSGKSFSTSHLRTYTENDLLNFISIAEKKGFSVIDGYDYTYKGNHIYDYTFASLALLKNK